MIWEFPVPLVGGRLIKRYKRFLADVTLDSGETITAHCPNTGSMKTCGSPGDRVLLSLSDNPKRKLPYTWELTETEGGFIGINTVRPNQVTRRAVESNAIPELSGYETIRGEVKYGQSSRIDLYLETEGKPPCYVEVKNTTLVEGDQVTFPDAVTARGLKHLRELQGLVKEGKRAVMFFFVNRPEGSAFAPADGIDPEYGKELRAAAKAGVEILVYRMQASPEGYEVAGRVPLSL